MTDTTSIVETWMNEGGVKYEADRETGCISCMHKMHRMEFWPHPTEPFLRFDIVVPYKVPDAQREVVAEYLTRANFGLPIGCFSMDMDDGEIRFRIGTIFHGSGLTPGLLRSIASEGISIMEKYFPGVAGIMAGGLSAEQAIGTIEG